MMMTNTKLKASNESERKESLAIRTRSLKHEQRYALNFKLISAHM